MTVQLKIIYYILIISSLLTSPWTNARDVQNTKPLVREILQYRADSVIKLHYYYDEYLNKVMEVKHVVHDYLSQPRLKTEWIYDKQRCVMQRTRLLKGGQWVTTSSIETVFDGDLKLREIFRDVNNGMETITKTHVFQYENNKLKTVLTYPGNPELLTQHRKLTFTYNEFDSIVQQQIILYQDTTLVQYLHRYTYNNTGQKDSVILTHQTDSTIVSTRLSLHYYNTQGQLRLQVQKRWNPASLRWINAARLEYTYNDQGRLIEEIYASHNGMFWKPDTRYSYRYDEEGLLAGKTMFQPVYKEWRRFFTIDYAENKNARPSLMESKFNFWGGNTGDYVTTFIPFYFNDEIIQLEADKVKVNYIIDAPSGNDLPDNTGLRVYPNPSEGIFYISTQSHEVKSWEVYNMGGVLMKNAVNQFHTGIVDITGLQPGVYLLRVKTVNQQTLNQKIFIKR